VVGVEVGQHQAPHVRRLIPGLADRAGECRRRARRPGIDQRQAVAITLQVDVPGRKADEVQARRQLDDLHTATVTARRAV
jgi:hypothetical protein